jgi:hypothetical protein
MTFVPVAWSHSSQLARSGRDIHHPAPVTQIHPLGQPATPLRPGTPVERIDNRLRPHRSRVEAWMATATFRPGDHRTNRRFPQRTRDSYPDRRVGASEVDVDALAEDDWVEDHLAISDLEPGRIWFEGGVGPIAVPRKASDLARAGWSAFVTAARTDGTWRLLEVGFVYP